MIIAYDIIPLSIAPLSIIALLVRKEEHIVANKDLTLNPKIEKAAFDVFMECGFEKASMNKIAQRAGVTTGAIYTRYKSKDDLFESLVSPLFKVVADKASFVEKSYLYAQEEKSIDKFMNAIKEEQAIYDDLICNFYEECILLFDKGIGSETYKRMYSSINSKAEKTILFFKNITQNDVDLSGLEIIITSSLYFYHQILMKNLGKEKTIVELTNINTFIENGWINLFETILK